MPPRSTGFQAGDLGGATASGVVARAQTPEEALVSPQINRWQYHSKNVTPGVYVSLFSYPLRAMPDTAGAGSARACLPVLRLEAARPHSQFLFARPRMALVR